MRKAQKKKLLDIVQTLYQAHEEVRNLIVTKSYVEAMQLLGDCQQGAIHIGETIEEEGDNMPTIALIEGYCEMLFLMYNQLNDGEHSNNAKGYKALNKHVIQIENSIKNDIKVQIEAVFLPYKASMWDSLESIWKAADSDPDCNAYVIPIPYYDKNLDGSFEKKYWEGNEYPDDVPVTHYGEYDLKERKPDMIYIHNPYDETNRVTSVHPSFYSEKLKEYTEQLVYVPYFISNEISPDNVNAIEGMKHFFLTPGVMNADKVIVQSEDMRTIYINVLVELSGEDTRKYWSKKVLGLGSPKMDKVLNTRKEDLEIPKEWLEVIRKPNGEWKKVILYNTTIGTFLQHGKQMIKKIESVLEYAAEHECDLALIWRPHPLTEATIKSMRPQLLEEYQALVRKYRKM